ncbi:MAG: type II toxin-antitoxin system Phd/YefM family antitoxin [Polyangiales bacterium]
MDSVNALTLRQSLGAVLQRLREGGAPVLIHKGRQPAAVLISLEDYQKRFVDREADAKRQQVAARIAAARLHMVGDEDSTAVLRALRDG